MSNIRWRQKRTLGLIPSKSLSQTNSPLIPSSSFKEVHLKKRSKSIKRQATFMTISSFEKLLEATS